MHNIKHVPASFGQERIWSLCQSLSQVPLYNFGFSAYLEGEFDVNVMQQTINIIVKRHEALRTTFAVIDNKLTQIIAPELDLKQKIYYRENVAVENISDEIKHIAKAEILNHFDLQDGPLIRNIMIKFTEGHYGWVVVLHHAISDGWSAGLFAYETNIIFRALATNNMHNLSNVPMQYSEYVNTQRDKINNEQFNQSLKYWESKLNGVDDNTHIIKAKGNDSSFEHYYHSFSAELLEQLNSLSKRYETTLFNILLIAFRITLWKYKGQTDSIITVPVAERSNYKSHKSMGYFINLLPIRIIIPDEFQMMDFINHVINNVRESFFHADVPVEFLSQHLELSQSASDNPLYQTLFSLQNFPIPANIYNYKIREINNYSDITEFKLNLRVTTFNNKGQIEVIYNSDCYQKEEIQQLMEQYCQVLETMHERD